MGWFDEQIRQRMKNDDDDFSTSFAHIASSVTSDKSYIYLSQQGKKGEGAIRDIMNFFGARMSEVPSAVKDLNEKLEYLMRPYGIMRRQVRLSEGWRKDAMGAMLARRKDSDEIVALIPRGFQDYYFYDFSTNKDVRVTKDNEKLFSKDAIAFYRPMPLKQIGITDLTKYIYSTLTKGDLVYLAFAALVSTLIGLLIPRLNSIFLTQVVDSKSISLLLSTAVFMFCVTVSMKLFDLIKTLMISRISLRMNANVQAATMMRVLSLPTSFFKKYGPGDLSQRVQNFSTFCDILVNSLVSTGLTSIFSLAYLSQIASYTPSLVFPVIVVIAAMIGVSIVTMKKKIAGNVKELEAGSRESGVAYSLISGVQKIKLAGAEKRAFAKWAEYYSATSEVSYSPPNILRTTLTTVIPLAGTIAYYFLAVHYSISVADYYVFNSAYSMIIAAVTAMTGIILMAANIQPLLTNIRPILQCVPEVSVQKTVLERVTGSIELNNVSFRYTPTGPDILNNISLKIRPGEYVGIVGRTGCGKSTLMRLLLGFEEPQKGAIYYDGRDLSSIDLRSLRKKIGVVMQNGKLFQGDIYSNITVSAPWLSVDDAWQAAELAGMADDIRSMPMGMFTIISEGNGGISGGQRQRIMIARAIASKPRILFFDEATSALDNVSQKIVSQSLDSLKCTRIVIAHRLSTIRNCSRIVVLDDGKIIADGTYDELLKDNEFFRSLVERQQI